MASNTVPPTQLTLQQPQLAHSLTDYGRLLYWLLYYPQYITLYARLLRQSPPGQTETQIAPQGQPNTQLYQGLLNQIAILALFLLWFALVLEWIVAKSLWNPAITLAQLGRGLLVSTALLMVLCAAVYWLTEVGIIPLFSDHFFYYILYADLLIFYCTLLFQDPLILQGTLFALYSGSFLGVCTGIFGRLSVLLDPVAQLLVQWFYALIIVLLLPFLLLHFLGEPPKSPAELVAIAQQFFLLVVTAGVVGVIVYLRPDDCLWGYLRFEPQTNLDNLQALPHVTLIPFWPILGEVEKRLNRNWLQGLQDTEAVLALSCQKAEIASILRRLLMDSTYNVMLDRLVDLFEHRALADLLHSTIHRSQRTVAKLFRVLNRFFASPLRRKSAPLPQTELGRAITADLRSAKPDEKLVESAVEALNHLRGQRFSEASDLFKKMRSFQRDVLQKELGLLAMVYTKLRSDDDAETYLYLNAQLEILRGRKGLKFAALWDALDDYKMFVRCRWVHKHCHTPQGQQLVGQSAARYLYDAIVKLAQVAPTSLLHPLVERLTEINREWQKVLTWNRPHSPPPPLAQVKNPFTFVEPMQGRKLPASRQPEIQQISNAWVLGNLQPIILYGQRQIGKTSLIFSLDKFPGNLRMQLIYVNLRQLGAVLTLPSLLVAISQEIDRKIGNPAPNYSNFRRQPYQTFRAYIKQTCALREKAGLMIVFDEFDHIQTLTQPREKADDVLSFFWELAQSESQVGFTFITTSLPDSLRTYLSNPFMTAAREIRLRYLRSEGVQAILDQPDRQFLLYFHQSAVNQIFQITRGHPYLVQALAYCLVEDWNSRIIDNAPHPDPLFTQKDVVNMTPRREFRHLSEHYYTNLWQQVEQDNPQNTTLLQVLAQSPDGFTKAHLVDNNIYHQDLHKLRFWEIISYDPQTHQYAIAIDLFRQWILATM